MSIEFRILLLRASTLTGCIAATSYLLAEGVLEGEGMNALYAAIPAVSATFVARAIYKYTHWTLLGYQFREALGLNERDRRERELQNGRDDLEAAVVAVPVEDAHEIIDAPQQQEGVVVHPPLVAELGAENDEAIQMNVLEPAAQGPEDEPLEEKPLPIPADPAAGNVASNTRQGREDSESQHI